MRKNKQFEVSVSIKHFARFVFNTYFFWIAFIIQYVRWGSSACLERGVALLVGGSNPSPTIKRR